jgi:hypothetical protein
MSRKLHSNEFSASSSFIIFASEILHFALSILHFSLRVFGCW